MQASLSVGTFQVSVFFFYLGSANHSFSVQEGIQVEAVQSLARPVEERNCLGGCTYHNYSVPSFFGLLILSFRIWVLQRTHPIKKAQYLLKASFIKVYFAIKKNLKSSWLQFRVTFILIIFAVIHKLLSLVYEHFVHNLCFM